jgi:hypothetical protein
MQGDSLEQYIRQNRQAFDEDLPQLKVWSNISQELDQQTGAKRASLWHKLKLAAAVVLLLACGALIGGYITHEQNQPAASLEEIAPEYAGLEAQYQREIQQKYQQLAGFQYAGVVEQDLERLDQTMKELKAELKEAPPGKEEAIVQSLLENYRAKVLVLERVLQRIQAANPEGEMTQEDEDRSI